VPAAHHLLLGHGLAVAALRAESPGAVETAMGWEVYPDGLAELLIRLHREYAAPKIYVTENGAAFRDTLTADGTVEDKERLSYLEDHVAAVGLAVRSGVPVAGYFAWSLLDNFEWAYGYDKRFGLVHVDYDSQVRTIKASGYRYAELIREQRDGGTPVGPLVP
jgi:beta-glucosidase